MLQLILELRHTPLDAFGDYSTGVTLSKALGFDVECSFGLYRGVECGVVAKTQYGTVPELVKEFSKLIGHNVQLYPYGKSEIENSEVAVLPGGGSDINLIREIVRMGINTVIMGVSFLNESTQSVHDFEKSKEINLIGGTHYSTEKFACQKMCEFFHNAGIQSSYIPGTPLMKDL